MFFRLLPASSVPQLIEQYGKYQSMLEQYKKQKVFWRRQGSILIATRNAYFDKISSYSYNQYLGYFIVYVARNNLG